MDISVSKNKHLIELNNGELVDINKLDTKEQIKELKEDRKKYAEEYIHNNPWLYKQLNENYILRVESEQRERGAYIKGTNDADELCNKKWEDKIKEKVIEIKNKPVKDEFITASQGKLDTIIEIESLLERK